MLRAYDYYLFAAAALLGTIGAAVALLWALLRERWRPYVASLAGISPQFMNLLGVLFALTLAFLANDTWSAHDRALAAVDNEADALRSIVVIAGHLPAADARAVRAAVLAYARAAVEEWPKLATRETDSAAADAADRLLAVLSDPRVVAESASATGQAQIGLALSVRNGREARLALSQTHVNPFKWAGMAFLGFLTMLTVALVHVGTPRPMVKAVALFALASAPTVVIVLIHGNPFQSPGSVSAAPFTELIESVGGTADG